MNTIELAPLLAARSLDSKGQPLRVVCLDDGCIHDVRFTVAKVDSAGSLVTAQRLELASDKREPLDRAEYAEVYNDPEHHAYWSSAHSTFEDFYAFMDNARLAELKLIDEAVEVAVLHADYVQM